MARVPMVTRTIKTTKVTVLAMELEKAEPFNRTIVLTGTYKDDNKLMKAVEELFELDKEKPVHIVDKQVVEQLYGMEEAEFVKHAKVLEPRVKSE